jgi:hypothetical protein
MSCSLYAQPEAERRAPARAVRDSTRAASKEAMQGMAPPHATGNQGMLRLLRSQSAASLSNGVSIVGAPPQVDAGSVTQQPTQLPMQQPDAGTVAQPDAGTVAQPMQQPTQPAPPSRPTPYTAVFSIAQHGSRAKTGCGLPDTPNCVVSAANWNLIDKNGARVAGNVTLSEQFTKESGPDDVYQKLVAQANSSVISQNGAFGDCYGLCVPDGTPSFSLQVLQNYLVNGQIASKTHISYSPTGVMLRVCQREADGTFGDRCRRF